MPAGITLKDSEGRLLLTNRMFEEWYDLPREYLLGKRIEEVRPDIVHDPTHSAERAVVAGQKRVQVEQEVDFADGSMHHVLYTAFPVRSDDGSEVNVATIGIDLTEQNNTERLLVESEERFLPIRLTPMTATCRVPPLSRVKLGIGWSRGVARDAEQ